MSRYEMPPILSGSSAKQLSELRAYLVRMAAQLNDIPPAEAQQKKLSLEKGKQIYKTTASDSEDMEKIRKNAVQLRSLILKTADGLGGEIVRSRDEQREYTDASIQSLSSSCLARSEFGSFTETLESQIRTAAEGVLESYDYSSLISSAQNEIGILQSYMTSLEGQIRRGLVTDPATNEIVTGIAISQNLRFTGQISRGSDGIDYYELSSGQTFGLYTSTGWQFWIDGYKRGWYDSVDGMLHIANTAIENALQIGAEWRVINEDGLGIKYIGG